MKLYGAVDLHSNNSVVDIIDEQDRVMYEKRLPNELPFILGQLSPYQSSIQGIVVESTFNWVTPLRVRSVDFETSFSQSNGRYSRKASDSRGSKPKIHRPEPQDWIFNP